MEEQLLQQIADYLYHIEGIGAGLIAFLGLKTGFSFAKYFFERCLIWM